MRPGIGNKPHDQNDRETGARKYPWSQHEQEQPHRGVATPELERLTDAKASRRRADADRGDR
jgi:hypothetical protein